MSAAITSTTGLSADGSRQFCSFRLRERLYGVDILSVREVVPVDAITPVPHAPACIRGYVNVRGQIHLVVDLGRLLGLETGKDVSESKIVIFKSTVGEAFGVLVDKIADVVAVDGKSLEDRRAGRGGGKDAGKNERRRGDAGLTLGVCKLEKEILVALDPAGIIRVVLQEQDDAK